MRTGRKGETKSKAGMGMARLPTLQGGYNNDPRVLAELEELKQENDVLREKIKKLEGKVVEIARSKGEVEGLREEEEKAGAESMGSMRARLAQREEEVDKLKKEIEERISQSAQVVSMKKIIQQKNEQINGLKERLQKYEKVA
eukprot:TRINITY_DN8975_c0_g1_i8.p3 TRINITY_DN8975_c0_g1~~TRINITY_DN8975_c0_g1_i8.p3  ORF type:complete len:143 (+),score=68.00 TRINITY_DN8975_c0_g1_i8:509-937(+)